MTVRMMVGVREDPQLWPIEFAENDEMPSSVIVVPSVRPIVGVA